MTPPEAQMRYAVERLGSVPSDSPDESTFRSTCFFIADQPSSQADLFEVTSILLKSGCMSFLIWGKFSDTAENNIDSIIEDLGEDYLAVTTTSERDEPIDDAVEFFCNKKLWRGRGMKYYLLFGIGSNEFESARDSIVKSLNLNEA